MTYIGFYSRFLTFDALYLQNRLHGIIVPYRLHWSRPYLMYITSRSSLWLTPSLPALDTSSEEYVRRFLKRQNDADDALSSAVKTWVDAKKALNP